MAKEPKIPKPIENEIATTGKDLDIFGGWLNYLENPDPVLSTEAKGKGIKLYDEIARDPHAASVLQTRYLAVVGKEWSVTPAESGSRIGRPTKETQEQKIAQFVEQVLCGCNFDQMRMELLQGILYGYYGTEIMWTINDGSVVIDRFLGKHARRFCFDMQRVPRLLTPASMITGEELPDKKFLIWQYGDSDNPYGKGLGQKLWWMIWFKKNGIKFWVTFMEKFGMPTPVGKYPPQAKEQRAKLLEAIDAIRTETGIVIPDTMAIEFLEASRSGDGSYAAACEYFDMQISKAVLGQTLTTEVGSAGSYAASQTHNDVRQDIIEADADLLDAYLNKMLIPWIVDYNFPGVIVYPKFVTNAGAKPDLEARSRIDGLLLDKGLPITKSYFYETYGVPEPEEGEEVVERSMPQLSLPIPGEEPAFAESKKKAFSRPNEPDVKAQQAVIDGLILETIKQGKPKFELMTAPIFNLVGSSESLEQVRDSLYGLYDVIDADRLQDLILQAKLTATLYGRAVVQDIDSRWTAWKAGQSFAKEKKPQPENFLTELSLDPLPPEKAMKFFKGKVLLSAKDFYDLTDQLRSEAFTVSRVAKMDIIKDIHEAVQSAIDEGETLSGFRSRLQDIVQSKGWGGLEPWHEETVFRTNIQTAYSVGHEQEVEGMEDAFPYAQYVAIDDDRVRDEHLALNGKIFPVNHPFWNTWTVPNGYNCFPLGTKVLTLNGWKNIESINVGDNVIGGSGNEHHVKSIHRNIFNGNLVRLSYKGGFIASTPNHRILTMDGWKRSDQINDRDILIQTKKIKSINHSVADIDKPSPCTCDRIVPIPFNFSRVGKAFNSNVNFRDKNIYPFRAVYCSYNVIMNWFKSNTCNMVKNNRLIFSGECFTVGVNGRILRKSFFDRLGSLFGNLRMFNNVLFSRYTHFFSNFRASCRSRYLELFGSNSSSFVGFFGLAKSRMSTFFIHLNDRLSHFFCCFNMPFVWSMEPLSTDGFASSPWFNGENLEEFNKCSIGDIPSSAKLPIGKFFVDVQTTDDFSKAAPFDMFNTIDDFRNWCTQNAILHKVESMHSIPYNGTIVNLSIDKDNSYIVEGATVHNCRCSKRFIHKYEAEAMGYTIETINPTGDIVSVKDKVTGDMKLVKLEPGKGFAANPAKVEWVPSKEDYPEPLWGEFEREKEMVGR